MMQDNLACTSMDGCKLRACVQAQEAATEAQAASAERLEELRARITSRQRLLDSDQVSISLICSNCASISPA